jgi:hypothetical protein
MRRTAVVVSSLACLAFAACANSGAVNATFSNNAGGAGGFGGNGGSGAGSTTSSAATTSSTTTTTSTTTSSTSSTTSSTSSTSSTTSTGTGSTCDFSSPNTCDQALEISAIDGDTGSDKRSVSGSSSKWFKLYVHEGSNLINGMSFTVTLQSPPGMDYDLYVYQGDASMPNCFATPTHALGDPETFMDSWSDSFGSDDSRWYILEVRYISGMDCTSKWTLTVSGNT